MPDTSVTSAGTPSPPTTPVTYSNAYPVLLGPVRVETRFTATELLVRVLPDDWAVDSFEESRATREHEDARRFWSRYWQAGGDHVQRLDAWREFTARVGIGRAGHIVGSRRPLNPADEPHRAHPGQVILVVAGDDPVAAADRPAAVTYWRAVYRAGGNTAALQAAEVALTQAVGSTPAAKVRAHRPDGLELEPGLGDRSHADITVAFLDLAEPPGAETRASAWTQPTRARLLPDRFTLLGFTDGHLVVNVTGNAVPPDLPVGPAPSTPPADRFKSSNGALYAPAWLTDFDRAVALGIGFRVPLTDAIRDGLDQLIVLGLRARTPAGSKTDPKALITHQAKSRAGSAGLAGLPVSIGGCHCLLRHLPSSEGARACMEQASDNAFWRCRARNEERRSRPSLRREG